MSIDPINVPAHVAIIMDGNGRWAKERGLPRIAGHREGVKAVEVILAACKEIGVKILTLYAFSTENWKRPKEEILGLMKILENYLLKFTPKLNKEGVRLNVIGDISALSAVVQNSVKKSIESCRNNKSFTLNLAINYGSRQEILRATKAVCQSALSGDLDIEKLKEDDFSQFLYTAGMSDPDILIRTSGEMRISNFLLWQLAYSEIYVTKKFWPDFKKKDFVDAITEYQSRRRRFGGH